MKTTFTLCATGTRVPGAAGYTIGRHAIAAGPGRGRPSGTPYLCGLRLTLIAVMICVGGEAFSAENKKSPLNDLHDAVAAEKYHHARKLADQLLQAGDPAIRSQVARPLGRILLATGDSDGIESYFKLLEKAKLDVGARELVDVYKLWKQALDGDTDEAIEGLQAIVATDRPTYGALEAADILAILELQRGNRAAAKKIVDSRLQLIKYNNFQDPYIERLLKGRLASKWFVDGGEAERLYHEGEALRRAKKFNEAGRLYVRVQAGFPASTFADAAGFRIGQCYVGLDQHGRAESHWRAFLTAAPKGPWRGQAHAALAEVALLERLDTKAAGEQLQAAVQAYEQGVDDRALPSWQQAARLFYLQQAIIALAERRHAAAVTALDRIQHQPEGASPRLAEATMHRLQKIATEEQNILPAELYQTDRNAQTITALGAILLLLDRHDDARRVFAALIHGNRATRSAPHRSFAALELARLSLRADEREQARKGYQYSLAQHEQGGWHDQTLRELALLIERAAREKHAAAIEGGRKNVAQKLSDQQQQAQSAAYMKDRQAAVPYWVAIFQRYPNSPHVPQALFHMGQLYVDAGHIDWAATSYARLTRDYPNSPWTGDAHVLLIDVKLEREFDLAAAQRHAREALAWLEQLDRKEAKQARSAMLGETAGLRSLREVSYDIHVRAGLVEYLDQQHETAAKFFEQAKQFAPKRDFVVVAGEIPTGIERLITAARSGKSITPEEVLAGDGKAKLILMLADLYHEGQQYEEAIELCDRAIRDAPKASKQQQSWAYFKRGRCIHAQLQPLDAVDDFRRASAIGGNAPWCPTAMFYAANAVFNYERDVDRSIAVWKHIITTWPKSPEALKSTYYIGFALQMSGRHDQARQAYEAFIKTYPDSPYTAAIRKHHISKLDELDAAAAAGNQPVNPNRKRGS